MLDPGFADDRLAFCDTLPDAMTSSMHNDLMQGNRLELPSLSGSVVDLGREFGIPTPRKLTITEVLAPYELGQPVRTTDCGEEAGRQIPPPAFKEQAAIGDVNSATRAAAS
jgi:2-dehydropantoate 2-reductase